MTDQSPRVFGYRASRRERRLWRVFKTTLAVVTCLAAIQGVRSVYERAAGGFGYDFYQFWLGGDALRAHVASGSRETLDLYTDAAHIKVGAQYVEMAKTKSRRQREAADDRQVVDTASSPFFYWVFSILMPGDYDREYRIYIVFSVACMVGTIVAFAWRLKYSIAGIGAAVALAAMSAPVHSDFNVVNFNFPDLAICLFYLLIRERARNATRLAPALFAAAGVVMGALAAFKPNLLLFPVLLGVSGLISRRWSQVLAEAGGFGGGLVGAIAVSSWAFGGISCWIAWGQVVLALGSQPTMPSVYGNFSVTRNIYEITGRNFISLFSAIGILLAIGAIWLGRRSYDSPGTPAGTLVATSQPFPPKARDPSAGDIEFRHDLTIFGIAVSVTLLSSGLAWVHYPILLFPFLLLVGSCIRRGKAGITSGVMRYVLLAVVVVLLMFPFPDDIRRLLPFHIANDIRTWIHCSQAAVAVTLGLGLWYEVSGTITWSQLNSRARLRAVRDTSASS
jgi:hypothetical protein